MFCLGHPVLPDFLLTLIGKITPRPSQNKLNHLNVIAIYQKQAYSSNQTHLLTYHYAQKGRQSLATTAVPRGTWGSQLRFEACVCLLDQYIDSSRAVPVSMVV